ncbi:hypothetical protein SJI00_22225, partial [Pseudomonas sp. RP23018S]|nr:hypothetical protein [Pseudomonas sp. RP23018S]
IVEDLDAVTSPEENVLLKTKLAVVSTMFFSASVQLIISVLGIIRGFAWVMSSPAIIATAVLGVAYLLISMAANHFKREGLRLWLYRCNWGRGAIPEWIESHGHADQMQSLLNILMRPSVFAKAFIYGGERTPQKWLGHWIQIQFPALLEGQLVALQPVLLRKKTLSNEEAVHIATRNFYDQYQNGNWVNPKLLGILPDSPDRNSNQADFSYSKNDQHRLWQAWMETSADNPIFELKIEYIANARDKIDYQHYIFRLALDAFISQANSVESLTHDNSTDDPRLEASRTPALILVITQAR